MDQYTGSSLNLNFLWSPTVHFPYLWLFLVLNTDNYVSLRVRVTMYDPSVSPLYGSKRSYSSRVSDPNPSIYTLFIHISVKFHKFIFQYVPCHRLCLFLSHYLRETFPSPFLSILFLEVTSLQTVLEGFFHL